MHNKNEILLIKLSNVFTEYFGEDMASVFITELKHNAIAQEKIDPEDPDFLKQMVELRIIIDTTITYAQSKLVTEIYPRFILDITTLLSDTGCLNLVEEILINAISEVRSDKTYALLLMLLADIYIKKSFWDNSINLLDQAVEILTKLDDKVNLAKCENLYGTLFGERGDVLTAKDHFLKGVYLLNGKKDEILAADFENNLAILENIIGNIPAAKEHYKIAMTKFEDLGQAKKIAEIRHNLGMFKLAEEQYEKAMEEFDRAIKIAEKEDYKSVLAISYLAKANVLLCLKNYKETTRYCFKAIDASIKIDDKLTIAETYKLIGILERERKHYDTAEKYFLISLRLNKELDNRLNYAESAFELGELYRLTCNVKAKSDWLNTALSYYTEINATEMIKEIKKLLD